MARQFFSFPHLDYRTYRSYDETVNVRVETETEKETQTDKDTGEEEEREGGREEDGHKEQPPTSHSSSHLQRSPPHVQF